MGNFDTTAFDNYTLDAEAEKKLWSNCVFVFDTSALLAWYRLTNETHESIKKVLDIVKERLWMPNHVQFEFMKNRENSLHIAMESYDSYFNKLFNEQHSLYQSFEHKLMDLDPVNRHKKAQIFFSKEQYAQMKEHFKNLKNSKKAYHITYKEQANLRKQDLKNMLSNDTILDIIKMYFTVGAPYKFDKIISITREGFHRSQCSIPPGFNDSQKEGTQKYGDLIVWKQIIDFAKKSEKDIVFVTNDVSKGDWGDVKNKNFESPLYDLITEFYDATSKRFWIYTLGGFLSKTDDLLGVQVPEEQLKQVIQTISEPESTVTIKYQCNKCPRTSRAVIDAKDLEFEVIDSFDRSMGFERQYEANTKVFCPHCQNPISVIIVGWEYPEGSPMVIDIDIDGAKLFWATEYIQRYEDHWDEICQDRHIDQLIDEMRDV